MEEEGLLGEHSHRGLAPEAALQRELEQPAGPTVVRLSSACVS